jgi:hypothetical protein
LFSVLPLRNLPGLTLDRKVAFKENDLLDETFGILVSRGEGPEKATRGGGGEWEPIKILL